MTQIFASRYLPEPADPHALSSQPPPRADRPVGVLLINLGTPDHPDAKSIRRYLGEFLSDPRVIEIPQWIWQVILRGFILTRRPQALAPRYKEIWLEDGSPLLVWSQAQAEGIQQRLAASGVPVFVELGMRYGNPSVASAIDKLRNAGCERILVVPMYPQYAASTTATAVDCVAAHVGKMRDQPELRFVKRYHTDPGYIGALAAQVHQYWGRHGTPQRLLLSFHGLPRRTVEQGDPYHRDCMETAILLKERLGPDASRVHVSFQSRFGAEKWLEPYTEPTLREWARQGVTRVDVMCPGFLADCLETREEIQMQCRDAFLEEGGQQFRYLPCLNDDPAWIAGFTDLVKKQLTGWIS
ncbi:ferrochelatase [Candidimonas sp. SYP-B2681]|uniref:ferrochelatase n=1 Tax=Candidimonas sp. SYP-B2681 TaxID=2497686 RepID=UPI000F874C8D|nr:ferrochelatase [Candidimonas sp. SYP-B2681]RTZ42351.1 ferrochelatase [Candidimonas sp. SYP-B2681]